MEMKISEKTFENDWNLIKGKFVIELEKDIVYEDDFISKDINFWMEKRISFVTSQDLRDSNRDYQHYYLFNGFYYNGKALTQEQFIKKWNTADDKKRYIRLMTKNELKQLFKYMSENAF